MKADLVAFWSWISSRWTARTTILAFALAIFAAFALGMLGTPKTAPAGTTVIATPAKELRAEPTQAAQPKKGIQVYRKSVKKKLKLPDSVQADEQQQVVSSSKVATDDRPHTVTTTVDLETGKFTTFDRTDPLPWVAVSTHGEAGLAYGIRNGQMIGRVYATQDLIQVKALHVGAMATLDQDGKWFAGLRVGYRW